MTSPTEPVEPATLPDLLVLESPFRLELVRVPAGEFRMGSDPTHDEAAESAEMPKHWVYVSEFYVGKYTVTNAQYAAYAQMNDRAFKIPDGRRNHPVVEVSWDEAVAFCQWFSQLASRNMRLPTEAEWEKAARGTDGRIYPWGDTWDSTKANTWEGGMGGTTPVGKYSPAGDSPYGVADMAGNVWEWVSDWYNEDEYKEHDKSGLPVKDPAGPMSSEFRIVRGGSWNFFHSGARAAYRHRFIPDVHYYLCGFRLVAAPVF